MFRSDFQHRSVSKFYDLLNDGAEYDRYVDLIERSIPGSKPPRDVKFLDLACGTGEVTKRLYENGHKVIALDISSDMLCEASTKFTGVGMDDVFFTCQDMRSFCLYSKVDAVICLYDSLNYLLRAKDVSETFGRVSLSLDKGGVFIFDISTRERYEEYYSSNTFVFEKENVFCSWENEYDSEKKICDFYLTLFASRDGHNYERFEEHQRQKYHPESTIKKLLDENGFGIKTVLSDKEVFPGTQSDIPFRTIYITEKLY